MRTQLWDWQIPVNLVGTTVQNGSCDKFRTHTIPETSLQRHLPHPRPLKRNLIDSSSASCVKARAFTASRLINFGHLASHSLFSNSSSVGETKQGTELITTPCRSNLLQ